MQSTTSLSEQPVRAALPKSATQDSVQRRLARRVGSCEKPPPDLNSDEALRELLQMHDFYGFGAQAHGLL